MATRPVRQGPPEAKLASVSPERSPVTCALVRFDMSAVHTHAQPAAAAAGGAGGAPPLSERYEACMLLSGVGDAMGYHAGGWEFIRDRCAK